MRNTESVSRHPRHKKKGHSSPLEMSEGEASDGSEERVVRTVTLKRSISGESDSSPERPRKHKKKRKKHRRKHRYSESDVEVNSETEYQVDENGSPRCTEQTIQRAHLKDRDDNDRRRRHFEEGRRKDRGRDDFEEVYEQVRIKQESVYEDGRGRHYDVPSRQRHSDSSRHRERTDADYHARRHHRRDGGHPRHEHGKTSSSHRGHGRYREERPSDTRSLHRERKHSEEEEPDQPARGRTGRGDGQGSKGQRRDEEESKFNPNKAIKQERVSPQTDNAEPQTFEWGKKVDNVKQEKPASSDKEKPNFALSGKLTEETNTFNGVVIKYSEPPEARKPRRRWRFYPFKGEKALQTLYIHRQSSYLLGRDRKIADIPIDHPSCSKQHAVLQYRLVGFTRENGTDGKRVRPYIIDLESANGTFVNNKKIEAKKYVELLEKDVVKFGFSSREYVLLHEHSKDDDYDDVGEIDGPEEEAVVGPQSTAQ